MNEKKDFRIQLKEKLSQLSRQLHDDFSNQIADRLYMDDAWKKAHVIGITISKFPEVDTHRIIQEAWKQGKLIAVPKCYPKEKKMSFRIISDFSQLESVFYGLLEPIEERTPFISHDDIDLLIVPGLGYTRDGFRIGFGGGYYDRYLKDYNGQTVSLAFELQIIPSFKKEDYDMPVGKIMTNKEVIIVK
jgi:5-formyltetrahydrofolate cyclo-ligase